jgi:hypothetical protein
MKTHIGRAMFVAFILSPWLGLAATFVAAATILPEPISQQPIVYIDRNACIWRDA